MDVWPEELRSATSRSHGPVSGQHQAVLVTFLEFRKLTESCTERMCNSSNVQVCHVRGKFTRPSPVLVLQATNGGVRRHATGTYPCMENNSVE